MNRLQNIGLLKQTGKQWGLNGRTSQGSNIYTYKQHGSIISQNSIKQVFLGVQLYTTQAKPTNNNFRKNMIKYSHPTSPLAGFNQRLALKLRSQFHNPRKTLDQVLEIIGEIKQQQLKLDIHSYNALLIAYARNRTHSRSVFDTLTEMREAGVEPNTDSYNAILDALSLQGAVTLQSEFKNEMIEKNIPLTTTTYYHLLRGMGKADALEFALNTLEDMKEKGVQPNIECYGILIGACLRLNESSAAFDLLKEAESMDLAVESQPRIYLDVLRVASNCDKVIISDIKKGDTYNVVQ
jgi:pentatricopeptide repeat protein